MSNMTNNKLKIAKTATVLIYAAAVLALIGIGQAGLGFGSYIGVPNVINPALSNKSAAWVWLRGCSDISPLSKASLAH